MTDVTTTRPTTTTSRRETFRANLPAGWGNAVTVAGAWIVLIVISGIHRADFLSHQTVLAISFTMAIAGIMAVAQALVQAGAEGSCESSTWFYPRFLKEGVCR